MRQLTGEDLRRVWYMDAFQENQVVALTAHVRGELLDAVLDKPARDYHDDQVEVRRQSADSASTLELTQGSAVWRSGEVEVRLRTPTMRAHLAASGVGLEQTYNILKACSDVTDEVFDALPLGDALVLLDAASFLGRPESQPGESWEESWLSFRGLA